VVARCLQKRPEHRYANIEELVAALAPHRSGGRLVVPPFVPRRIAPISDAGVSVRTVHTLPQKRLVLTALLGVGAIGLVLIAVAGFAKLRGASRRDASAASTTLSAPASAEDTSAGAPATATPLTTASATATAMLTATAATAAATTPATQPAVAAKPRAVKPVTSAAAARHRTDW
jgi:hypothetical protein